jgi:hypothetical protein
MPPRNPSEFQRLIEEREDLLERLRWSRNKAHKEELLREVRKIEGQLDIESKPYNV